MSYTPQQPPAEGQPATNKLSATNETVRRERYEILQQLEDWLETPVMVLGLLWLVLLIIDLTQGLTPFLNALVYLIWGIFVLDFAVRFVLAPDKTTYLRRNWLTALSLFIPALRVGRLARVVIALRAARGVRLVSVVGSFNRGMRVLRRTLERHQFGYVVLLTLIVVLIGAAGMYAFERAGLHTYGEALWWTGMIMTTLGSEYWPVTAEGRLLTLLLSTYALAVFGYITATLATFFIGQDAADGAAQGLEPGAAEAGEPNFVALMAEIRALRGEVADLRRMLGERNENSPS